MVCVNVHRVSDLVQRNMTEGAERIAYSIWNHCAVLEERLYYEHISHHNIEKEARGLTLIAWASSTGAAKTRLKPARTKIERAVNFMIGMTIVLQTSGRRVGLKARSWNSLPLYTFGPV